MRESLLDWPFSRRGRRLPPVWPRGGGVQETAPRRRRLPEPWEQEDEAFDGRTVLEDLELCAGDASETALVLARYVTVRLLLGWLTGELRGAGLEAERAAAAEYLAAVPPEFAERRWLAALAEVSGPRPPRVVCGVLIGASREAERLSHLASAFALCRASYVIALQAGWPAEGARAASAVAALAEAGGGRWSVKRWRRRARVLARRAARAD
ncbi:MAG TPA: hypothetical protein VF192_03615 [Longimicrobiales bacterium]